MAEARRIVRARISGRVQGVGFRAWTRDAAEALGLDGWVRNRPDGTVEALLAGPPAAVEKMMARLAEGPRAGSVERVETLAPEPVGRPGFRVLR